MLLGREGSRPSRAQFRGSCSGSCRRLHRLSQLEATSTDLWVCSLGEDRDRPWDRGLRRAGEPGCHCRRWGVLEDLGAVSSHKSRGGGGATKSWCSGREMSLSRATDSCPMVGMRTPNSASSCSERLLPLMERSRGKRSLSLCRPADRQKTHTSVGTKRKQKKNHCGLCER